MISTVFSNHSLKYDFNISIHFCQKDLPIFNIELDQKRIFSFTFNEKILVQNIEQNFIIYPINQNLRIFLERMFPNDDICNVKAAKDAAKRIFNRYKEPQQARQNSQGLGQKQVSNLIKNAYQAINITYDPSTNDVSSFMSVFGVGQNGKIDLSKIQEMAVKYLCGQDQQKEKSQKKQINLEEVKTQTKRPLQFIGSSNSPNMTPKSKINQSNPLTFKTNGTRTLQLNQINGNYSSPKSVQSKNQFFPSENVKNQVVHQQKTQKPTFQEFINKANEIFHMNKNTQVGGITINQAPKVLTMTYELIGKKKYNPTQDDVKIWMKLCDSKRIGIIDQANYQKFVKRILQRENIKFQS